MFNTQNAKTDETLDLSLKNGMDYEVNIQFSPGKIGETPDFLLENGGDCEGLDNLQSLSKLKNGRDDEENIQSPPGKIDETPKSLLENEMHLCEGLDNLQSLSKSIHVMTSPFHSYLNDLYDKYRFLNEGAVANYIPELALAKPEWFGISVVTTDGQVFEVGDCDEFFTVQSISKVLTYGLALEDHGWEDVNLKVGVQPTVEEFNSIALDKKTHRPYNPMMNSGAIAITDLIKGKDSTERLKRLLDVFRRYTGRKHDISLPVFLSEKITGNRNRAMAYLMRNFGIVSNRIEETLDLYFQQCAVLFNAHDLAMVAATLANGGINPITKERAIEECYVQDLMSVMLTCGVYDYSGEWAYRVGIPAKSGVGGGITAAVPGIPGELGIGIGVFSPPLDTQGNSVRGIKVCEDMSRDFGLHLFNVAKPKRVLKEWIEGHDSVNSW